MAAGEKTSKAEASEGASLIVLKGDAVLMVERARAPFKGLWSFPGGRADPNEDGEATARRELFEEAGLEVGRLVQLGSFNPNPASVTPFRLTVFAARVDGGMARAGDDAIRAEFVPLSAVLTRKTTAGAAAWIARAITALADLPPA
jgi:8-oxo-dGTP pyrophosphatase MutT (NUDIX family)